jgi:hypothetical protein
MNSAQGASVWCGSSGPARVYPPFACRAQPLVRFGAERDGELRIMRYELTDHEWAAIKPMLPNKHG